MRTGQTALEFMVLLGFMLIVFTSFVYVVKEQSEISTQTTRYSELITVSEIVQEEVSTANRVKDGYRRVFELPRTIGGAPYTVMVDGRSEVTMRTVDREYFIFLPTNVSVMPGGLASGALASGKNVIQKGSDGITLTPITATISATPNPCSRGGAPTCAVTISWSGTGEGTRFLITDQSTGAENVLPVLQGAGSQPYALSQSTHFRLYTANGPTMNDRIMLADDIFVTVLS